MADSEIAGLTEDTTPASTDNWYMQSADGNTDKRVPYSTVEALADAKVADAINNGTTTVAPSQNAVFDALALKADDSAVVHDTGAETVAGVKTFSSDPIIPDEAYDATNWNGVLEPPTKNAVRDALEALPTLAADDPTEVDLDTAGGVTTLTLTALIARARLTFDAETGTTYTPTTANESQMVTLTNGSAITLTLPQDSAVTLPVGSQIHFTQLGAGLVTFVAGSGATVDSRDARLAMAGQYAVATAVKRAADTWLLFGDLA